VGKVVVSTKRVSRLNNPLQLQRLSTRWRRTALCLMLLGATSMLTGWVAAAPESQAGGDQLAVKREYQQVFAAASDYQSKGFGKLALPLFNQALLLAKQLSQVEQIHSLLALARVNDELGHYGTALGFVDEVLGLPQSEDDDSQVEALNLSATIYSRLNDQGKAREFFILAEAAAKSSGGLIGATVLANRLRYEMDFANHGVLPGLLDKSWSDSQELSQALQTAELQVSLAVLYLRAVNEFQQDPRWLDRAVTLLGLAGDIAAQHKDHRLLSYALGYKGQILFETGESGTALPLLKAAVFYANDSLAHESAYLWEWQLARVSVRSGQVAEAIEQYYRAIQTLEPVRQSLIDGSPFTFHQKIQPLFTELSSLLLGTAVQSEGDAKQSYLQQVQVVLEQAKSAELQDYFQNDCVIPEKTLELDNIEPATAVLYPVILSDRLSLLVNVGDKVHLYTTAIDKTEFEALVNEFRYVIQSDLGDDEYLELGAEIYQLLIKQAEPLLKDNQVTTLLFVPDGVLRTIPMAALYDGEQFLVEKYAVATTPGVSMTMPAPLNLQSPDFFAGGVSDSVQGMAGLPGVTGEINNLKSQYGASSLLDESFLAAAVSAELASTKYSIFHIATHGHFNSNPQKSFLLAYDKKLTMDVLSQSIATRQAADQPLELLVLSACESAAGDQRAALGLAGVALKAGARSALATLWEISDLATVEIINTFYSQISIQGVSKAQALRTAQMRLISQPRFSHPNYWAPYMLIGNWL
jgi:CHAT domain-containing protein